MQFVKDTFSQIFKTDFVQMQRYHGNTLKPYNCHNIGKKPKLFKI